MKRFTILDENFVNIESIATDATLDAQKIYADTVRPIYDATSMFSTDVSTGLRFSSAYINTRATLNPMASVSFITEKIIASISERKRVFSIQDAAVLSSIYISEYGDNTPINDAFDECVSIFGGYNNIECSIDGTVTLSDSGLVEYRRKLSAIREDISTVPSRLNSAVNNNEADLVKLLFVKLALLKKFADFC